MEPISYCQYVKSGDVSLFTVICLPRGEGKYPTVLYRTPYAEREEALSEAELCEKKLGEYAYWLEAGYAVVYQHCRGRGKSEGDCVPYIYEREDGLALQAWAFLRAENGARGKQHGGGKKFLSGVAHRRG